MSGASFIAMMIRPKDTQCKKQRIIHLSKLPVRYCFIVAFMRPVVNATASMAVHPVSQAHARRPRLVS